MNQPGKVANPSRGRLNKKNEYLPVPVRALEFGRTGSAVPSRISPFILHPRAEPGILTHGIPSAFRDGVHIYHQPPSGQSLVIGSRNCVSIVITAESSPAQDHYSSQGSSSNMCCLLGFHDGPIIMHLSFPTPTTGL